MFADFPTYLDDARASWIDGGSGIRYRRGTVPVEDGIARFIADESYSAGNFARLRDAHQTLQLDSRNGTDDRWNTVLSRSAWPPDFFRGKTLLECGCGAGPDTEILLRLGARVVAVDLSVDAARRNIGSREDASFVQASIMDLPLRSRSFDIVWCHRVIQHTPDPEATLDHILRLVAPQGAVFVHSYARSALQMLRWKYALRPLSRRMDPERLYRLIKSYAPTAFRVSNAVARLPGGRYLNHVAMPFLNYRQYDKFANMTDEQIIEYGVHDTFDALSPAYDRPMSATAMRRIADKHLQRPFEVTQQSGITLLRSVIEP